jgi:hypothetical protein
MDPEKLKAALDAIEAGDKDAGMAILKELIAAAAGGGAPPAGAEELAVETPAETPPKEEPKPEEMKALALLTTITGTKDLKSAALKLRSVVEYVDTARASNLKVDAVTRLALVGKLVQLRAESPASAFADPDKRVLVKRLANMDLDDMQQWVTKLEADPTRKPVKGAEPPEGGGAPGDDAAGSAGDVAEEVKQLSAPVLEAIKKRGMTPEQFIAERNKTTRRIHK